MAADALLVARLATLSSFDYDRSRKAEALRSGIRLPTLDGLVQKARRNGHPANDDADPDRPPEFTDESLALRFTALHKDRLRYVASWGRWLIREPTVWRFDETLRAFDLARAVARAAAAECEDAGIANVVASAKTVAAIERLAKADRRHASTIDEWDVDPWILNTPGGVVDLNTGNMRPHNETELLTKITAVSPGGKCPLWEAFLTEITGGNEELIGFLQRFAGYSLTGITREQALCFGYGTGANGKGTFLNTLTGIMGNYAATASVETFTASKSDHHPTDLAMLRGARLVTAQETEEGRAWAEGRIKALTGGDPITARFMRQDFFTFNPQFKLFIAGNHKPGLRNVDEAIRRRLNLVPFAVKIPSERRDPLLAEKLRQEWSGILRWMIDGCLDWLEMRLTAPKCVSEATEDYLEGEDSLGIWLKERTITKAGIYAEAGELFKDWKAWAILAGEEPGTLKRFIQSIEGKGFVKGLSPTSRRAAILGLKLPDMQRPKNETSSDWNYGADGE